MNHLQFTSVISIKKFFDKDCLIIKHRPEGFFISAVGLVEKNQSVDAESRRNICFSSCHKTGKNLIVLPQLFFGKEYTFIFKGIPYKGLLYIEGLNTRWADDFNQKQISIALIYKGEERNPYLEYGWYAPYYEDGKRVYGFNTPLQKYTRVNPKEDTKQIGEFFPDILFHIFLRKRKEDTLAFLCQKRP